MLSFHRQARSADPPAPPRRPQGYGAFWRRPALAIVLAWLAAMFWLVRYEAFPAWFGRGHHSYRDLLSGGLFIMDSWMRVSLHGQPAGYTHTWVDSDTEGGRQLFRLRNQTALSVRLLGRDRVINASIRATVNDAGNVLDFYAALRADAWDTRVEGRAVGNGRFHVTIRAGESVRELEAAVPADALLHLPMTELLVGRLAPGRAITLRVFNPLTMAVDNMRVAAVGRETLRLAGRDYEATLVKTAYQGLEMRAWVDGQGRTLRQETPLGLTMEICAPAEAALPAGPGPSLDWPALPLPGVWPLPAPAPAS